MKDENKPWLPNSALKLDATTTVGNMKGTAVRARSRDLSRKLKREKRTAEGRPRVKVRTVERVA